MANKEKIAVVGAGITGVSAASVIDALGHDVTVYESNRTRRGAYPGSVK